MCLCVGQLGGRESLAQPGPGAEAKAPWSWREVLLQRTKSPRAGLPAATWVLAEAGPGLAHRAGSCDQRAPAAMRNGDTRQERDRGSNNCALVPQIQSV